MRLKLERLLEKDGDSLSPDTPLDGRASAEYLLIFRRADRLLRLFNRPEYFLAVSGFPDFANDNGGGFKI